MCVPGHCVPQLSQAIVRYNKATKGKAINLRGYMVLTSFAFVSLTCNLHDLKKEKESLKKALTI